MLSNSLLFDFFAAGSKALLTREMRAFFKYCAVVVMVNDVTESGEELEIRRERVGVISLR